MKEKNILYLGVHLDNNNYKSIIDGLNIVKNLNGNVLQIFLGSKYLTSLKEKIILTKDEINEIKLLVKEYNIKLFVHSILSLNYCKDPFSKRNEWGIDNLVYDMNLCYKIGGEGVVLHLGTHQTQKMNITYDKCEINFINSIQMVLDKTKKIPIILETPVNRKFIIGGTIEKLAELYNNIANNYKKRVKLCIDTQHIFASGYNIRTETKLKKYLNDFDKFIGIKNLVLIHLNDSKKELNSRINRHFNIGKGFIFKNNTSSLKYLIDFSCNHNIPLLMETNYDNYKDEIKYIKKLFVHNIKKLILKIFEEILSYYESLGKKGDVSIKYKIDSYKKALDSIKKYKYPIYNSSNVKDLPFIGKKFCEKIDLIAKNGTLNMYENIKKNTTSLSIHLFQKIWGVGPEQAQYIVNNNIFTIKELKDAVKKNNIKLNEQQLIGLKYYDDLNKRISRSEILYYTNIIKDLIENDHIKIYNAGSYRIGKKYSGDIDLIITYKKNYGKDLKNIVYHKLKNIIKEILVNGNEKSIYIIKKENLKYYRKIDIAYVEEKYLPWYLLYFGSSRDFSKKIRSIASKLGYKLSEKGLYYKNSEEKVNFNPSDEKDIFKYLHMEYIPPEKRI